MSLYDRSAQFAAYKALSGFEDMVNEEARVTDKDLTLEEYELEKLDRKLRLIAETTEAGERPTVTFTVFVPDEKKSGGRYTEITDAVKKIDAASRKVVLMSTEGRGKTNRTIEFDKIAAVDEDKVKSADDTED